MTVIWPEKDLGSVLIIRWAGTYTVHTKFKNY